ncbi:MAG: c-type cytochrome [Anaerolineales bacterium]|jgi:mono/diheme cytochrome c family protein
MNETKEDYGRYLTAGLLLTILVLAGLTYYWVNESPRLARAAQNFTQERVDRGRALYSQQCVSCHGVQGEGGVGPALNNRTVLKNTLDNVFFSVIRSGVPNTQMPAWSVDYGGPLTDEDIRDVVAFLRAWEPTAPEIEPAVFVPDAQRGALLFSSTCAICHGENGAGTERAPRLNNPERLGALADDWYRATIRNGRPAKGMPTWGTVLSPNQIDDLVALIDDWRSGVSVQPAFSVTQLLDAAAFSLREGDKPSAKLQIKRALGIVRDPSAEILNNAVSQLDSGDLAGASSTIQALRDQWPLGDATRGAQTYSASCAPCHGVQGEGGIGKPLHANAFIQSQTNSELVDFILSGRPGTAMAGFKDRLDEEEIANVIAFLRLWQQ